MKNFDNLKEEHLSTDEIFDGCILHVIKDKVKLPNGNITVREVVRHIGAVCVIPVTDENEVIIERQYRYPIDGVITEIPAGKLDSPDENILEAAKRELREETGITADKWTDMGLFYPAAAYCDETITMFMAQGLHFGSQNLDDDEFLNVEKKPLSELVDDVMSGNITDSKTQTAILKAARLLGI